MNTPNFDEGLKTPGSNPKSYNYSWLYDMAAKHAASNMGDPSQGPAGLPIRGSEVPAVERLSKPWDEPGIPRPKDSPIVAELKKLVKLATVKPTPITKDVMDSHRARGAQYRDNLKTRNKLVISIGDRNNTLRVQALVDKHNAKINLYNSLSPVQARGGYPTLPQELLPALDGAVA